MKKVLLSLTLLSLGFSSSCLGGVTIINNTGKKILPRIGYGVKPRPNVDWDAKKLKNAMQKGARQTFEPVKPHVFSVLVDNKDGEVDFIWRVRVEGQKQNERKLSRKERVKRFKMGFLKKGVNVRELEDGATYEVTVIEEMVEVREGPRTGKHLKGTGGVRIAREKVKRPVYIFKKVQLKAGLVNK